MAFSSIYKLAKFITEERFYQDWRSQIMKTILFGSAKYDLVDNVNVHGTRFQATIYKGEQSVEQIAANTVGVSEIKVYDEEQSLLGVYNGYTERVAISLYQVDGHDVVSIELENGDVASQVANLSETVELQAGAIESIADKTASLSESQTVQDGAIEALADTVAALEPTT